MPRPNTHPLHWGEVARQAYLDWFGKEVQTGYTLTYVWMANQLGHFTLGFVPTCIGVWIWTLVQPCGDAGSAMMLVPGGLMTLWTVKELYDVCVVWRHASTASGFRVDMRDTWLDALTALTFFGAGIVTAYLSFVCVASALIAFGASLVAAFVIGCYWLRRKMCFQLAGLPFQYRLSSLPRGFGHAGTVTAAQVQQFCDPVQCEGQPLRHLLVFGKRGSQKSSFAAGVGTEWTFRKGRARYTTLFRFLQLPAAQTRLVEDGGRTLWGWNHADLLIVDDVNLESSAEVGSRPTTYLLSHPNDLAKYLRESLAGDSGAKLEAFRRKRTVWVIGLTDDPEAWRQAFASIGFGGSDTIGIVVLG